MLVPGRWRPEPSRVRRRTPPDLRHLLTGIALRLEYSHSADELLAALADLVAGELDLPYVLIEIDHPELGEARATNGAETGRRLALPLTYQGSPAGRLVVTGPRAGGQLSRRDRRALAELARNAGAALHTARLLTELRQGLDRVLYAREEERRRLRHELHDSVGPILAGISLGLHAARHVMATDTAQAEQLVSHLEQELQSAIGEVRRLFETLRPPVLDQLGLVPAVREQMDLLAARLRTDEDAAGPVEFTLHTDGELTRLPAIVEVAAYRIVCEALTNVARHSQASACSVTLTRDKGLRVEVVDDGVGISGRSSRGLGLGSMRERAAELGGSFVIDRPPRGGTRLVARLPVHPPLAGRAAEPVPAREGS